MNFQKQIFTNIYNQHSWGGTSKSGPGSDLEQTKTIIETLPKILLQYEIKTFFDAPCGDFNWIKFIDFSNIQYIGGDIVDDVVKNNIIKYSKDFIKFITTDIIIDTIPKCDMMFTRDCLVHFPIDKIFKFFTNLIFCDVKYFMSTSFVNRTKNTDICFGDWRPLNLLAPPFNFPKPLEIINEKCTENGGVNSDKSMCIWAVEDMYSSIMRPR